MARDTEAVRHGPDSRLWLDCAARAQWKGEFSTRSQTLRWPRSRIFVFALLSGLIAPVVAEDFNLNQLDLNQTIRRMQPQVMSETTPITISADKQPIVSGYYAAHVKSDLQADGYSSQWRCVFKGGAISSPASNP